MTTADYLESLQDDLKNIVTTLELDEGTNFTGISTMCTEGEITKGGGGSGLDWTTIGFASTPPSIQTYYNSAKNIYDNWDNSITDMYYMYASNNNIVYYPGVDTSNVTSFSDTFNNCQNLISIAPLNTSNATSFARIFSGCEKLQDVPVYDLSKASGTNSLKNMFNGCPKLTTQSLDNILQMCIGATNYSGTKTLYQLGFRDANYPSTTIEALTHYSDFTTAGWTIGY